jgi:predicted methyltransferase
LDEDFYASIVSALDRSEADRELDAGRKPAQLLKFSGVRPGMQVAELAAGGGYTAELLARVVGAEGKVYGQNTPFILERFAEAPWSERLKKEVMSKVERIDSELTDPLPGHEQDLDAVFLVLFYHDTVWFETDRARMNRAIYSALKPGGEFVVVDHSAKAGDGVSVAKSLHRIEESTLVKEVTAAGFSLEATGDFLRNEADARDWNASPSQAADKRGTSDRFVLLFRKPDAARAATEPNADATILCTEPRKKACTRDYRPVCGSVDTGVRCIKAPCPSTESHTFSNGCSACADGRVQSYLPGACPDTTAQ